MAEGHASTSGRPLARSLDPLAGESVGGYLLRLACRLHLSPIRLARLTGCGGAKHSGTGRWPPAPGTRSSPACRPSPAPSAPTWTTANDRRHPPSSGPASPEASRCSLPGSSRPASPTTSAGPGSYAAAAHGFNSGVLTRSTTMQPCGRASTSTPTSSPRRSTTTLRPSGSNKRGQAPASMSRLNPAPPPPAPTRHLNLADAKYRCQSHSVRPGG